MLKNKTFWLLFAICALTLLPFIGLPEYHTKGEPRESVVSYSMLVTDNWMLPRNNGGEMAYKPPFFHWCVAMSSLMRGAVTEGASRLPSAVALIGMTLFGFCFVQKRRGTELALLASLVTFTSFELHRAGANCRVDMMLTALTVGALYCLYNWHERGMRGIPIIAILLMALGTLTKGPVGTLIPCLVTGVYMLLRRENFFKTFLWLFLWGALSFIPYILWFYAAWQQGGQEFIDLMYEENIGRMTSTMSYESCVNPWYYNIVTLVLGWLPWTLLLVFSLFGFIRRSGRVPLHFGKQQPIDLFSWTAIVVIFVFYCIPQSKRSVYLMPMYPFVGYFIARYLLWLSDHKPQVVKAFGWLLAVVSLLLFVCFAVVQLQIIPDTLFHGRHAADNAAMLHALEDVGAWWQWLLVAIPTLFGLYWCMRRKDDLQHNIYAVLFLIFGLYIALDGVYSPTVLNTKSVKAVSKEIRRAAPAAEGTLYEYIEEGIKAKGDPVHFFEVNFYLGNRIENFHRQQPDSGFLLISKTDFARNSPDFQRQGYRFALRYETPKREMQVYTFKRGD